MKHPKTPLDAIAFDADDTLWHCENQFHAAQNRLFELLEQYASNDEVAAQLGKVERENVRVFGYGIKGFTLSMVETALEISRHRISAAGINEILILGKEMLEGPVVLFDGVTDVLHHLGKSYPLYLITKGDILDQKKKIDKSNLADCFAGIEVVSEKNTIIYSELFEKYSLKSSRLMMVGNSIPSDILPVLELGGFAVHIPYGFTALFEQHRGDPEHPRFCRLHNLLQLPDLIDSL
jgi:putative hydrolase of the HAD superfamily